MHIPNKNNIILYLFYISNEEKLENVSLSENEIYKFLGEIISEFEILQLLKFEIGNGLVSSKFIYDDPDTNDTFYSLTPKGIERVKQIFSLEQDDNLPIELNDFQSLYFLFIASNLPNDFKQAYEQTIFEILKCYKYSCLNATISLCGKLLEIYLTELLVRNKIAIRWFHKGPKDTQGSYTEELTLGQLFILTKSKLETEIKIASIDENQIEIIKKYRNSVIHHNKTTIIPTPEITMGIINFCSHFLKIRLTWE